MGMKKKEEEREREKFEEFLQLNGCLIQLGTINHRGFDHLIPEPLQTAIHLSSN